MVSKILPAAYTCSLISAKVSFRRGDNDTRLSTKLEDQWLQICKKRDECDRAIKKIQGLAFFFSAISSIESKVDRDNIEMELDEEDKEQEKKTKSVIYWPAISYWIAVQSPNGTRVSTVPVHNVLLSTEMEVNAKVLPECQKGKEEQSAAPLCTSLKDHNNNFLQEKVDLSFSHGLKTLQDQLMEEPLEDSLRGSERVVRLQIISTAFCPVLRDKGVPALVRAGLKVDVFGIENSHPPEGNQCISKALASPIVIAMNDVERAMEKLGYSLYKGEVYKKVQSSKYTFSHCCTVKRFLSVLGTNESYKETIVKHLHKLDSLLSDSESEFGKQMQIDFDLIEVSDGWCFSLSRREFVENAICHTDVGRTSPRAFVEYRRDKLPDVTFFQEILENSLSEEEIGYFCEYFVRLLNYGTKQHKEKVLCLVGEPNSGKTSLFAPITAIIPQRLVMELSLDDKGSINVIFHPSRLDSFVK